MNAYHKFLLDEIKNRSGKATRHTFLDSYLGNTHPRYPINAPTLRMIAREWMKAHKEELTIKGFTSLLSSLIEGESGTEKTMAGVLLDYSPITLRKFEPSFFNRWLTHLQGWAEVDSLCTGAYTTTEIPGHFPEWKKQLIKFSKSKQIEKRRASLVLLCSPLMNVRNEQLIQMAFNNIDRLKPEKEILITKAISWLLRSAVKHYKKEVQDFVTLNKDSLPKIALRETLLKLKTGKKTKPKKK
jgi:3-methyladenine DNA glycosylase AlkD